MAVIKVIKSLTRRQGRRGRNEREGQKRDRRLKRSDAVLAPGRGHRREGPVSRWEGRGSRSRAQITSGDGGGCGVHTASRIPWQNVFVPSFCQLFATDLL